MKNFIFLFAFSVISLPAGAYQAGQQNRTNFGQSQTAQPQYRSFSNYNNRSWGQGVQTRTVQTEVAGKSAKELKPTVGKQAAPAAAKPVKQAKPAAAQPSTAPAAMPANMDPTAMMQQVQGMMNAMGSMTGGGAQPGQPAAQGAPGQNAPAAAPAMPDISALMGGAMPATPAQTPAKK